jgi:hypothetical protein
VEPTNKPACWWVPLLGLQGHPCWKESLYPPYEVRIIDFFFGYAATGPFRKQDTRIARMARIKS